MITATDRASRKRRSGNVWIENYFIIRCQLSCQPVLLDFSLTVKAVTLIFIPGRGWTISSAKEGKSGFIYNLVKSQ